MNYKPRACLQTSYFSPKVFSVTHFSILFSYYRERLWTRSSHHIVLVCFKQRLIKHIYILFIFCFLPKKVFCTYCSILFCCHMILFGTGWPASCFKTNEEHAKHRPALAMSPISGRSFVQCILVALPFRAKLTIAALLLGFLWSCCTAV